MAAACPSSSLHFVVSTDLAKPNPELRKLIRSHVMLGKNKGNQIPPRKKKGQSEVQDASPSSPKCTYADASGPNGHLLAPLASTTAAYEIQTHSPIMIPRNFGSTMSTIRFPDAVEPSAVEVVLQFSSIAKKILFPLEACMFFEKRAEGWIAPLTFDSAFLHAMIFTSQHYFDAIVPRRSLPPNDRIFPHLLKTLRILRERFAQDDDQARLSFTTLAAVMSIAGHALVTGDTKAAKNHIEGLHKIVTLRGGVTTFRPNAKLLVEILRTDLGMALCSDSRPVFFGPGEPFLPYPDLTLLLELDAPSNSVLTFDNIHGELAQAWGVMWDFCCVINFAVNTDQRISTETFLETMASVMYRLLNMRFNFGSSDYAVRLGLLAFSSKVLLQWNHLGLSYSHLASAFRSCLADLTCSPQLMVWLLMVGAVSVFDANDDMWLKPSLLHSLRLCEIESWTQMQDLLKSFMWIELVYDKLGKAMFDSIVGSNNPTIYERIEPYTTIP
ncbi:uncharacterized protein BDZ99DRAFT_507057 [Mytilinidion resinicola]|uniref:Transcription factor domain-containing protein n=1 Tax=Mytilinidion resinicola TaxID=574789 RepID=A0A6A6YUZ0_9PEZI|nr:uncharacterized protein BDZ99DRAFT_507057 [Mytilinidion resinicola]KAF2812776.1 hypothetical protein BDZ99DRAFT_507057 [Mytilinidion resinicola]